MKISFRVWILIAALLLALLFISPTFKTGVVVKSVERNSTAFEEGIRQGAIIKEVNSFKINDLADCSTAIAEIEEKNSTNIVIKTDSDEFILFDNRLESITVA